MADKEVSDRDIVGDLGKADKKTTIDDSEVIKQSDQPLDENVKKRDKKELKTSEVDIKSSCEAKEPKSNGNDIKESKVTEDAKSEGEAKEPKDDPEKKDAKESNIAEDSKSCDGAKEPKPTKGDCDGNDIKESVAEDAKSCDGAKEPMPTECEPGEEETKESKVAEDVKSCCGTKEQKPTNDDSEGSEIKESKVAEDTKSCGGAKESKPTKCELEKEEPKVAEDLKSCCGAREPKTTKGDPKTSDGKESKVAEDVKSFCDTKASTLVKGDEKESQSTDNYSKSSDVENANLSLKPPYEKEDGIVPTNSSSSISSSTTVDCEAAAIKDSEDDKLKSKFVSHVDYLEKGMPSDKFVETAEFLKLGALGSPEASGSKPSDTVPVSENNSPAKSEGACFKWSCFKRVVSPQKMLFKFKKHKSPKSSLGRPMISSECDGGDFLMSPGLSPIGCDRHFVLAFMGKNKEWMIPVDRIDYSKLAEDKIIPTFLGTHPCYDVMPISGKVIVLSVDLLVKNAFSALVTNEIKAAPLWDTGLHDFIGMLTISDFINVLRHYFYSNPEDIKDIENQAISTWRKMTKMSNKFIKINGSENLALATKLLIQEGVHRIPVFDEKRKCVLFVLTRKRLLQYLSYSLFEKFEKSNIKTPSFFRKTLRELQVGTYENIATTTVDGRVIDALDLFVKRKVSSLPVVDENGELKDIFEKFDVFVLAKEQTYHNLEMTVLEAITKAGNREGAVICTLDESLGTVINKFVNSKVHRIVVINERRIVTGIVSLSDILKFLVVQPLVAMEDSTLSAAASDIIEEGAEGAVGGSDVETSVFESGELDSSTSLLAEESDKNTSSLSEAITDMKISSAVEDAEEKLDSDDVQKSE